MVRIPTKPSGNTKTIPLPQDLKYIKTETDKSFEKKPIVRKSKTPLKNVENKTKGPVKHSRTKTISHSKNTKGGKTQSLIKKSETEASKVPVPQSKSSTYQQVQIQKPKIKLRKTTHKKKVIRKGTVNKNPAKVDSDVGSIPALDRFSAPPNNDIQHLEKFNNREIEMRIRKMKARDNENFKKMKEQYLTSTISDMHKHDMENTLRKIANENSKNNPVVKEVKKDEILTLLKSDNNTLDRTKQVSKIGSKIISSTKKINKKANNKNTGKKVRALPKQPVNTFPINLDIKNMNLLKIDKSTGSLTTHFRIPVESKAFKNPVVKKKTTKLKKSTKTKMDTGEGKDVKSTQISHHKKKSKANTTRVNQLKNSDTVPVLHIKEIKHTDSFVISARKMENAGGRSSSQHKTSKQFKLKTKRTTPGNQAAFKSEIMKSEQRKSCLKKSLTDNSTMTNNYRDLDDPFDIPFRRIPVAVN